MADINNFKFERIFFDWKKLEEKGRDKIEKSFQALIEICNNCQIIVNNMMDNYTKVYDIYIYDMYIKESCKQAEPITTFFARLKNMSEEGYEFLTEGFDIVNLADYLKFEGKSHEEIIIKVRSINEFVIYLKHSFFKLLDEENEEKKRLMLKGLIGTSE